MTTDACVWGSLDDDRDPPQMYDEIEATPEDEHDAPRLGHTFSPSMEHALSQMPRKKYRFLRQVVGRLCAGETSLSDARISDAWWHEGQQEGLRLALHLGLAKKEGEHLFARPGARAWFDEMHARDEARWTRNYEREARRAHQSGGGPIQSSATVLRALLFQGAAAHLGHRPRVEWPAGHSRPVRRCILRQLITDRLLARRLEGGPLLICHTEAMKALAAWDLHATVADVAEYDDEYRTEEALSEALARGLIEPHRHDYRVTEAGEVFLRKDVQP